MLQLVIFDCDGVMFNSLEANRHYYNHLLHAFDCPQMDEEELQYVHIHNVRHSVAHIFRKHTHIPPATIESYRQNLDYRQFLRHMTMEPDLLPFLQQVKVRYKTAISTNRTDTMDTILDTFALRPWFDMVVTALTAPRPKPAPDGLYMILDHFQVEPKHAIYIGDSEVDQEHCAGSGVELIAFKNKRLTAQYHVDDFLSILKLPPFQNNTSCCTKD
ncbi:HAD family hydrolase [Desulfobulbus oligotrophicus]|jgi:HAD superfamily hydrolase (TIGR01509 family)|uniref:phosphoglycolate phosphatase n=1 Tax=Desulfobulbus oligotrophicus TaxID=1909699 RepID=A0A7T6AQB0_9BACT|nr:HAD family hydrolase [Desulfobulbus oligotrophicus]MDY0389700.1 HAD family hydrolase [Desulfobulbus oligotrophicus]QQG65528.1 HAD family hydrolase [Desulfobulbus oligotrophicus]